MFLHVPTQWHMQSSVLSDLFGLVNQRNVPLNAAVAAVAVGSTSDFTQPAVHKGGAVQWVIISGHPWAELAEQVEQLVKMEISSGSTSLHVDPPNPQGPTPNHHAAGLMNKGHDKPWNRVSWQVRPQIKAVTWLMNTYSSWLIATTVTTYQSYRTISRGAVMICWPLPSDELGDTLATCAKWIKLPYMVSYKMNMIQTAEVVNNGWWQDYIDISEIKHSIKEDLTWQWKSPI